MLVSILPTVASSIKSLLRQFLSEEALNPASGRTSLSTCQLDESEHSTANDESKNDNMMNVGKDEVHSEQCYSSEGNPPEDFLDGLHDVSFRLSCLTVLTLSDRPLSFKPFLIRIWLNKKTDILREKGLLFVEGSDRVKALTTTPTN